MTEVTPFERRSCQLYFKEPSVHLLEAIQQATRNKLDSNIVDSSKFDALFGLHFGFILSIPCLRRKNVLIRI